LIVVIFFVSSFDANAEQPLCTFLPGDGIGGTEKKIGMQTGNDCVRACLKLKEINGYVNGVTLLSSNEPGCWCEISMNGPNSNTKYKTCFLNNIDGFKMGSYGLKFTVRSSSTMNFEIRPNGWGGGSGKSVKITKCSFSCVRMLERTLVASKSSRYPASEGWWEASQILAPQITMYFKKTNGGGVRTLYHNSNNGVTSEGTALIISGQCRDRSRLCPRWRSKCGSTSYANQRFVFKWCRKMCGLC